MKQSKDYTLLALFIPFAIATLFSGAFSGCADKVEKLTTFKSTENKAMQLVDARDYQIDISSIPDSIIVMDGHRYVGTIPMWDKSPLDSLLMVDNE